MARTKKQTPSIRFEEVAAGLVKFDQAFNRILIMSWVTFLSTNWNPSSLGVIHVSRRSDGSLVGLDGQHRVNATILARGSSYMMNALVYEGLTPQEEAKMVLILNDQKTFSQYAKYNASITSGEEWAIAIKQVFAQYGMTPPRAIKACKDAWSKGVLEPTISVLHTACGVRSEAYSNAMLKGTARFFERYAEEEVDQAQLVKVLGTTDPQTLELASLRHADTKYAGVAWELSDRYNKVRGGHRLSAFNADDETHIS